MYFKMYRDQPIPWYAKLVYKLREVLITWLMSPRFITMSDEMRRYCINPITIKSQMNPEWAMTCKIKELEKRLNNR